MAKNRKVQILTEEDGDVDMEDVSTIVDPVVGGSITTESTSGIAKPSPLPASFNFGPPESVPYKDGLYFPYFHGLIIPDIRTLREDIIALFFDCIPKGKDRRDAWKDFRGSLPSLVETDAGQVLQHLIKGLTLALNSQARLYVLMDGSDYLGYVLLGSHFFVVMNGTTHVPMEASLLRDELSKIQSVTSTIRDIVATLEKLNVEVPEMTSEDPQFVFKIGECLAKVNENAEDEEMKEQVAELSRLVGNWVSTFRYVKISPKSVIDTFRLLTGHPDAPTLDNPFTYYIPPKGWKNVGNLGYAILARHGPSSVSLRNAKGDEYRLNPLTQAFDLRPKVKKSDEGSAEAIKNPQRYVFCYEKPVGVAYNDWLEVKKKGSIKQDGKERAAPHRATVIRDAVDVVNFLEVFNRAQGQFPTLEDTTKEVYDVVLEEGAAGVTEGADGLLTIAFDFEL